MAKPTTRKRGMGGLFKKGAVYYGRITIAGKTIKQSLKTTSEREAKARLAEMLEPLALKTKEQALENVRRALEANETAQAAANVVSLSLSGAWLAFETSPERKPCADKTLDMYRAQWQRFAAWATARRGKGVELKDITRNDALAFMVELGRTQSNGTYNMYAMLFKRMWRIIGENAGAAVNPWEKIALKGGDTHRRRALTIEELADVLAAADAIGSTAGLMFRIGVYTGLRMGDVLTLQWGDIDMARGIISLIPHKTRKHGTRVVIPLHPQLFAALDKTATKERRGRVLDIMNHNAACRIVAKVFDTAGIERNSKAEGRKAAAVDVGFHSLRHTFVSLAGNAGIPLAIVQSIVGHTDKEMTEHYFHASLDAQKTAVAALPTIGAPSAGSTSNETARQPPASRITVDTESLDITDRGGAWDTFTAAAANLDREQIERAIEHLKALAARQG